MRLSQYIARAQSRIASFNPSSTQLLILCIAGAFNDPDYLLFRDSGGRYAQTATQSRLQFSVYSMLAAPLIISQDITLTREEPFVMETLLNREVIAVDQDALGGGGGGGGGAGDCDYDYQKLLVTMTCAAALHAAGHQPSFQESKV